MNEIVPTEPLKVRFTSIGWAPDVGIHRRGDLYFQEVSYSHLIGFGAFLVTALAVCLSPLEIVAALGIKLKYWIAGGLVWGAVCVGVPFLYRRWRGKKFIIDPENRTLTIVIPDLQDTVPWSSIVTLQILRDSDKCYQLNLVWRNSRDEIQRVCLASYGPRRYVVSLGNKYVELFGFSLVDQS